MVNTSKAIIVGHNSLNNWAGFNNWWQRKSKQIWLLQKRVFRPQLVCLLWPQWEQQHRGPKAFVKTSTPSNSHTQKDDKSPCLGCFLHSFSLQASNTSLCDHMYRGVELSSLCCVLQSILPAGYSPPTGCNEPAWAASMISIMGRQSSEKQTHCGALGAYGVSTHSRLGEKRG